MSPTRWALWIGGTAAMAVHAHPARADNAACFDAAEQAQLLRYRGDLLAARGKLLVCARKDCPGTVASDCAQWLTDVSRALPSLAIHAHDVRGHDVVGAAVEIDGERVSERLGGTPFEVNPGLHRVRLETPSGAVYEDRVLVVEGQKDRIFDATLPGALKIDGTADLPRPASDAPPPRESRGWRVTDSIAVGAGAVGMTAMAFSAYFEIAGQDDYHTLRQGCGVTASCSTDAVNASKEKLYVLAPVFFGVGLVSLGASVAALWLGRVGERTASARWNFDVVRCPGGVYGGVSRAF